MKTRHEQMIPWLVVVVLGVAWFIAPTQVTRVVPAPADEGAVYGLGDTRSVGQKFQAIRGLRSISIPIDNAEGIKGPLILHLRSDYFGEDIRTATLFPPHTYDEAVFRFRSISFGRNLVWVLEAPEDPDRTLSVYREIDGAAYPAGQAYVKGVEIVGNFGFTQIARQAQGIFAIKNAQRFVSDNSVELQNTYQIPVLITIFATGTLFWFRRTIYRGYYFLYTHHHRSLLAVIIAGSLLLHVWYSNVLPFNNDEGAYLLDAYQTNFEAVPVRDYLTKGPAYIYALKAWAAVVPDSIVALRLFSGLWWMIAVGCLYYIATYLFNSKHVGLLAAALIGLSPTALITSTALLLQVMSVAVGLAGLVLIIRGIQTEKVWLFAASAGLMVAAYLTRASSLVVIVVGLLLIVSASSSRRWKWASTYILTGIAAAAAIASLAYASWGPEKTLILFNLEALVISQERLDMVSEPDSVVRQLVQWSRLFWQSSPWLLAGVVFLPVPFIAGLRGVRSRVIGVSAWVVLLLLIIRRHWIDMGYHMPSSKYIPLAYVIGLLFFVLPVVLSMRIILGATASPQRYLNRIIIVSLAWLVLYGALYYSWGSFVDSYILEFIPPLILLGIFVLQSVMHRFPVPKNRGLYVSAMAIMLLAATTSESIITRYFHTGSMDIDIVQDFAKVVQQHVPPEEELFTAQSAIPALAKRPITFNYSHSGWYLYEARGEVPTELREIYFIEPELLTEHLRTTVQFVVTDKRTNEVYFDDYQDRQEILTNQFELIESVRNGEESLALYKRR